MCLRSIEVQETPHEWSEKFVLLQQGTWVVELEKDIKEEDD